MKPNLQSGYSFVLVHITEYRCVDLRSLETVGHGGGMGILLLFFDLTSFGFWLLLESSRA